MNEHDKDIIELLTSEYTGIYFVNLRSGEATPYSMNSAIESAVGDVVQPNVKYLDAYRFCVENLVCDEDKLRMAQAGSIGNIIKELRNKKTFETIYRDANNKYCIMKFIKMGTAESAPEIVALCFSEKDLEIRGKEESTQRIRKNLEIIDVLASEYTSVYYIDMKTDDLDTYTMNEKTESEFGQVFRAGIKYSAAFKMYVEKFVYPHDKERMLQAGSVYNILNELSDKKTFVTRYRNKEGLYCEMKFIKVGNDVFPKAVALGFSDRDEAIKEAILHDRRLRVFAHLVDDFACVNYIDLDADRDNNVTAYRTSELLLERVPGWDQEFAVRKRIELLAEYIVVPEEKEDFLARTEREFILEQLDNALAYRVYFHSIVKGEKQEYCLKFIADKDESGRTVGLVVGFRKDRD